MKLLECPVSDDPAVTVGGCTRPLVCTTDARSHPSATPPSSGLPLICKTACTMPFTVFCYLARDQVWHQKCQNVAKSMAPSPKMASTGRASAGMLLGLLFLSTVVAGGGLSGSGYGVGGSGSANNWSFPRC